MVISTLTAAASKAAAPALSKAAVSWLTTQLMSYAHSKKQTAAEQKAWTDIASDVVKQTQKTAERLARITTVAFPNHPVAIDSIYVPVTLERSSPEACFVVDGYPTDLLENEKKIILVDGAGMGKSTLSRVLYIRAITEQKQLPILIDLRRLNRSSRIESLLGEQFGIKPHQHEMLCELLLKKPVLFIFDGFDEIADTEKSEVSRIIRHFVDRSAEANFIITSRPELIFSDYTDFSRFKIRGLSTDLAYELIRKYGSAFEAEECAKALIDALKAKHDEAVHSFLQNPLLTSLLFRTYDYKSIVPVKRSLFYKQVFDALYEAHDLNKETAYVRAKRTGLHQDDFHSVLRAIASLFRQKKVVEVSTSDFLAMARVVSKSQCPDLKFSPDDLLHDVTHAVPLFTKEGDLVRWSHKSLLDYFLAEFLLRDYSKPKDEALQRLAFGSEALANENLLSLIQESDPILFAHSVTLPAAEALLARHQMILDALPDDVDTSVATDIANFCMSYEVVFSAAESPRAEMFATYEADAEKLAHVKRSDFHPLMIYHLGDHGGNVGIFISSFAAGLTVPCKIGGVPNTTVYQIARKYSQHVGREVSPPRARMRSMCGSRFRTGDFSELEDDFTWLMGRIGRSDLKLVAADQLRKVRTTLGKAVENTMKARCDEIF